MELNMATRIFSLILATVAVASVESQLTVILNTDPDPPEIYPGQRVVLTCLVTSDTSFEGVLYWMKKVLPDERNDYKQNNHVEVAANLYVPVPFQEPPRYNTSITEKESSQFQTEFSLTIKDAQLNDAGEIGCKIPENRVEIFKQVVVFNNIETVELISRDIESSQQTSYRDQQNVTFSEGEQRKLYCHVEGSYPEPEVKVKLGEKDITHLFEKKVTPVKEGNVVGREIVKYNVELKNESLTIDYGFNGQLMKCEAKVPGAKWPAQSRGVNIKLSGYTPKFFCEKSYAVELHQTDVMINCTVNSDPPIADFKVIWQQMNEGNVSVGEGESSGHFTARMNETDDYTVGVVEGKSPTEFLVSLHIDRVYDQHFTDYIFTASNLLGRTRHIVALKNSQELEAAQSARSDAGRVTISIVSLIVCVFSALS